MSHPVTSGLADAVDGVEEIHLAAEGGHVDDEALLLLGHDSGKKTMPTSSYKDSLSKDTLSEDVR